jgi:hypothetical protein
MSEPTEKNLTDDQINRRYVKLRDNGKVMASNQRVVDDFNASEFEKRMAGMNLLAARSELEKYMVNWGILPPKKQPYGKTP